MKQINLLAGALLVCSVSFGQVSSFSENFDSLSPGDYMGIVGAADGWTTWSSSGAGTAEDVQVTDSMSQSGSNSIFFDGAAGGGAHDVVLDFGGEYNYGRFYFEMAVYADSGYYFNLQGNTSIGATFPFNYQVDEDTLEIHDGSFIYYREQYTHFDSWATIGVYADLDSNQWSVLLNGDTITAQPFENQEINQIASLDLYPLDDYHDFFVDDIMWTWDTTVAVPDTTEMDIDGITVYIVGSDTFEIWDGNYVPYGIEEAMEGEISVFPNPATDVVTIAFSESVANMSFTLTDVSGKIVAAEYPSTSGNKIELDVSHVPSGVYFLQGNSKTKRFEKSLVISH